MVNCTFESKGKQAATELWKYAFDEILEALDAEPENEITVSNFKILLNFHNSESTLRIAEFKNFLGNLKSSFVLNIWFRDMLSEQLQKLQIF